MKALKQILSILIVISMMILTACSDSITSSLKSEKEEVNSTVTGSSERGASYSSLFRLDPGEHILLNSRVTSLRSINEYSVSNCGISKEDLYISASNIDLIISLPCGSEDFILEDLLIENRSTQQREIGVKLKGISEK